MSDHDDDQSAERRFAPLPAPGSAASEWAPPNQPGPGISASSPTRPGTTGAGGAFAGSHDEDPAATSGYAPTRESAGSPPGVFGPPAGTFGAQQPPPVRARRGGRWILVVIVAALIGAAVGAGVTAATNNSSGNVTIQESNAKPGAAVVGGNVPIPGLVDKVLPAVVSIDVKANRGGQEDQGTGMIISSNGMVITNDHVVALATGGAGNITVTESGTTNPRPAELVGATAAKDVALLRIQGASGLPSVTFGNSDKVEVGDAVVAIGNALGLSAGTPTVTSGIVSALGRTVTAAGTGSNTETLTDMIQTDAAINPGNSGGPLIDSQAQVIAMNTAVAGATSDGTSAQGIGFAIPSASIEALVPQLEKGGVTGGAYLGVSTLTVTPQLQRQEHLTPSAGAVVVSVLPGSPAAKAGLRARDVIVSVDGTGITSASQLASVVQNDQIGQTVSIGFYRGSKKFTTTAVLGNAAQER